MPCRVVFTHFFIFPFSFAVPAVLWLDVRAASFVQSASPVALFVAVPEAIREGLVNTKCLVTMETIRMT